MISIVICSINPAYLAQVKENISSTIGVEYELLIWDNRAEKKGICEVYNQMASQARFEFACFLHEDVLFETRDWGRKLVSIFTGQPATGVIGVVGSKYKSAFLSGWFTNVPELDCANIIHRYPNREEHLSLKPDPGRDTEEVVCVDGVFICCRTKLWQQLLFDEKNLTGFHFYDIDFSIRASKICKLIVCFDILLVHITPGGGDFGDSWITVALDYHSRQKGLLPVSVQKSMAANTDKKIIWTWLDVLKNYPVSWANKWKWISWQKLLRYPELYYSVLKFLLYKPLGLRYLHKSRQRK
jgi:hypothetical protein